jgi:hypothetical protein
MGYGLPRRFGGPYDGASNRMSAKEATMVDSKSRTKTSSKSEKPDRDGTVISDAALDDVTGGNKHIGGLKYDDITTSSGTSTTTTPTK